jgi:hypothetical protein
MVDTSAYTSLVQLKLSELTFAESLAAMKPLLIYIAAVVVYSIFIFKFYRFLARRDKAEV